MLEQNKRLRTLLEEARRWINHPDCPDWIREKSSSEREYRDTILNQIDAILAEPICLCYHDIDYVCEIGCPDCGHNYGNLPYCQAEEDFHK